MRSGIIDHNEMVLTAPIRANVERSCHSWLMNIFIRLATVLSISPISLENLFITRPVGFVSKKSIGALRIEFSIASWSVLAACRLDVRSQNELVNVTAT